MYDQSKVAEFVSAVSSAAISNCVLQVSEHFAGYFDELGVTILVKGDTSDDELRGLKNEIALRLAPLQMPFRWMVLFRRGEKSAGVLFPDGLFTGRAESSRVAVVLETENEQLEATANSMPVWAVDSPSNRLVADRFWAKFPNAIQRDVGLTLFRVSDVNDRYNTFVGVLDTVEEHHWGLRTLYVFGLTLTEQVRADLQVLGFNTWSPVANGFIATKQD
jgi:hypothetical protein